MGKRIMFFMIAGILLAKPGFAATAVELREEFHQMKMQLYAAQRSGDKNKAQQLKAQLDALHQQIRRTPG